MQRYIKTKVEPSTSVFGGNSSRDADYEALETITGDPVNNVQYEEIFVEEILQPEEEDVEEIITGVFNQQSSEVDEGSSNQISKTKVHYCPHCGNSYSAAGGLTLHIRSCLKQKDAEMKSLESRKCKICGKIYNSVTYLKDHMLRHAGKGAQKCSKCNRRFLDEEKLMKHEKMHETLALFAGEPEDGENPDNILEKKVMKEFTCSFCHVKFVIIFDSKECVKRRFACDECLERFKDADELKKHKESREEKKEHRCDRCGRQFVFEGFLQRHAPTCDGILRKRRH